ncbi:hypothetical protein Bca52824_057506 [Brassica carinata]|uniref:Uncharacterized protein n=1 Tax=Brassica carinata TaxID=52824 RepID=A0A8X7UEV2_BRACI|nr:hypothetical protein Bca52824_057506 [Brassica carinata]
MKRRHSAKHKKKSYENGEAVSVILVVQKVAEDVVDRGPEADHGKNLTTAYASGDILGPLSSVKLVQLFVCKEYGPVELLSPEEGHHTRSRVMERWNGIDASEEKKPRGTWTNS